MTVLDVNEDKAIEIVIIDRLAHDLEQKIGDLKRDCSEFREWNKTPMQREGHSDRFCSHRDRIRYIFAIERDSVVGMLILLRRGISFQENKIDLGGIGGLRVRDDHRRRGIASGLLRAGMTELKAMGCDIAYLCTNVENPIFKKLYDKFGFKRLNVPHTYLGKSGRRYADDDGMIAQVNSPRIYSIILASGEPFDIGIGNW